MKWIYIKTVDLDYDLKQRFKGLDIISIEDLVDSFEDLLNDYNVLKEKFEDFVQEAKDNYKFVDQAEQIGYNNQW